MLPLKRKNEAENNHLKKSSMETLALITRYCTFKFESRYRYKTSHI